MRPKPQHGWRSPAASTGRRVALAWRRWSRSARHALRRAAEGPRGLFGPIKELFHLAWPITVAMLGETAAGLVDTKLVGGLGASALAGVGMATVVFFLGFAITNGTLRGVKVRTAYLVGQGRAAEAPAYARTGMLIGAIAGLAIFLIGRDVTPILRLLQVDDAVLPFARDYMAARTTLAVTTCMYSALSQYRQGLGDTRTPMIVGIGGNVVNAALSYPLIYGHLGLPALGVRGAGYGTAVAELLQFVVMLALLVRDDRRARAGGGAGPSVPFRQAIREVLGLGVPTGLHLGFEMLAFTTFTAVLGSLGAEELAAHQVALNTLRASFLPGVAVSEATSILVARSLGGNDLRSADRSTYAALALAVSFMTLAGALFAVFGRTVAGVFSNDPAVVVIAGRLLLVGGVFQTLDAAYMVLRGALRGAKDVRWVAVVGTGVAWCCVPGSALLFGRIGGLGALGGWLGFIVETSLGATLLLRRWRKGAWRAGFTKGALPAAG